ncbi:unnamed protein product, partial [Ectocarpus sp. 12 AP-2014]
RGFSSRGRGGDGHEFTRGHSQQQRQHAWRDPKDGHRQENRDRRFQHQHLVLYHSRQKERRRHRRRREVAIRGSRSVGPPPPDVTA